MNALVIGGAGYIGSHAVYELIRAGHTVAVMDNLSTGVRHAVHPEATFFWGDVRHKTDVTNALDTMAAQGHPIDVVMHFAAKLVVPESVADPLSYYDNNVEGVRTMIEAMVDRGVKNVVFSSTAATYGEPASGICSEDDVCDPINPYGETKLACEKLIKWCASAYGLNYCIFRYFNVAGADASLKIGLEKEQLTWIVPIVMEAALGLREKLVIYGNDYDTPDGTCIRDYVHVTDLAQAHVLGAQYIMQHGESILCNLGSNEGYSVAELVEKALEIHPFQYEYGPRRPGDPARLVAKNDRVKQILGWEPKLGLEDILRSDFEFRKLLKQREEAQL